MAFTKASISFETIDVGGKYKGNDSESFIKTNPNEKVPVLDYNNFIIYESNAIIKFISEDNNFLIPVDIKVNALVNQ
jgi:glutathione S-transferase